MTSNEYLNQILGTLLKISGQINKTQSKNKKSTVLGGGFMNLGESSKESFMSKAQGIKYLSDALKDLSTNLIKFALLPSFIKNPFKNFLGDIIKTIGNKAKIADNINAISSLLIALSTSLNDISKGMLSFALSVKRGFIDLGIMGLKKLFDFMENMGENERQKKIERSLKSFESLSKNLEKVTKTVNAISKLLLIFGASILLMSVSLVLSSKVLGTDSVVGGIAIVSLVILGIVTAFVLLGKAEANVDKGGKVIQDIGKSLLLLSTGMVLFALGLTVLPKILQVKTIVEGIVLTTLVVLGMMGMMVLIGMAEKHVDKGSQVIKLMGMSLLVLVGGMVLFALGLALLPKILGKETNGGLLNSLLFMSLIIASFVGIFFLLSKAKDFIIDGAVSIGVLSLGIVLLSAGLFVFAAAGEKVVKLGWKGIGITIATIVGLGTVFALIGAASEFIIPGALAAILISVSLILFSVAVKKLLEVSNSLGNPKKVKDNISGMIDAVMGGVIIGTTSALTNGKTGVRGMVEALKNVFILTTAIALIMGLSLALSMFALALSAFAKLDSMRVINGYDKNGKPMFGDRVDIVNVGRNISTVIRLFLDALLDSTKYLTKDKAKAIKKLGNALTGRRGILSAVIQFAEVIKVFGQYGNKGEMIILDEHGKQIGQPVKLVNVAGVIANTFGTFIGELLIHGIEITGKQKRGMKRLGKALVGKNGILEAVMKFSDVLKIYGRVSANGEMPIMEFDDDGNPKVLKDKSGKVKTVRMEDVAKGIALAFGNFVNSLSENMNLDDTKLKKSKKVLKSFDDLNVQLKKLIKNQTGLEKTVKTLGDLSLKIGDLSKSLDKLDSKKLSDLASISAEEIKAQIDGSEGWISKTINKLKGTEKPASVITSPMPNEAKHIEVKTSPGTSVGRFSDSDLAKLGNIIAQQIAISSKIDWDKVSATMGNQISGALKNNHFHFEFSNDKSGVLIFE